MKRDSRFNQSGFITDFTKSVEDFLKAGALEKKRNSFIEGVIVAYNTMIHETNDGSYIDFSKKYINVFECADYQASIDLAQRALDLLPKKSSLQSFFSDVNLRKINLAPSLTTGYQDMYGGIRKNIYSVTSVAGTRTKKLCGEISETFKKLRNTSTRSEGAAKIAGGMISVGGNLLWKLPVGGAAVGILLGQIAASLTDIATTDEQRRFSQEMIENIASLDVDGPDEKKHEIIKSYFSTSVITQMFADITTLHDGFYKLKEWLNTDSGIIPRTCNFTYDTVYATQYLTGVFNSLQNNVSLMLSLSSVFLKYIKDITPLIDSSNEKSSLELALLAGKKKNCSRCPLNPKNSYAPDNYQTPWEKCCLMQSEEFERQERRYVIHNSYNSLFHDTKINFVAPTMPVGLDRNFSSSWQDLSGISPDIVPADRGPNSGWWARRRGRRAERALQRKRRKTIRMKAQQPIEYISREAIFGISATDKSGQSVSQSAASSPMSYRRTRTASNATTATYTHIDDIDDDEIRPA